MKLSGVENVVDYINLKRLRSNNNIYKGEFTVDFADCKNCRITFAGYKTHLSKLTIDGMQAGFPPGLTVADFKQRLRTIFKEIL